MLKIPRIFSLILLLGALSCCLPAAAQISFSDNAAPPVADTPEATTGLKAVYTLSSTAGVSAVYRAASATATVTWQKFSNLGGGYAQDIPYTRNGAETSVPLTTDDMGYIVTEDGRQTCFWVVNYANHICTLESLDLSPESDCSSVTLTFRGEAPRIVYYSVNGAAKTLSRGLTLEYKTLKYNEGSLVYDQITTTDELEYISGDIHVAAPLCNTDFTLSGDRFQQEWNNARIISSPSYEARAVEAQTSATQATRDVDNEQKTESSTGILGGSAPVDITFDAIVTDAAIYTEWQFAADPAFDLIDLRINSTAAERTFTEYGTVYARFICGDNSGECSWTSPVYTIAIGESKLECPNAFSPGSSEGTNDEWKVSYKSIVSFDCHIFNRWGIEVAHLTDPSQGWDGRHNGKLVKSGVFFYVIKARGADGKNYNLSGDINILHSTTVPAAAPESPSGL